MRVISLCLLGLAAPAIGHEYWIEPDAYQVPVNGTVQANFVNGQQFSGVTLPYLPQKVVRLTVTHDGATTDIAARMGDTPAVTLPALAEGLHVVAHETTPSTVRYDSWDSFQAFVDHKGFDGATPGQVRATHVSRGVPLVGFFEAYSRHVKSLVAVGDGSGADRALGLETEFIALENPVTDDMSDGMDLMLLWDGAPRPGAQVELFDKGPEDEVTITLHQTNAEGRVTVPVASGHRYLVDAVILRVPSATLAQETGAVWESLWAGLTFAVP